MNASTGKLARVVSVGAFGALCVMGCDPAPRTGHLGGTGPLDRVQAARYVLGLVNHDRAEAGLPPVEWDDVAARAGQRHADDMAQHGYTAHLGTDGSVPEQRYSEAGGVHLSQENAACFFDGVSRQLDGAPEFSTIELAKIEAAFMAEVPPNDGHRKNILSKWHTHFGVGLSVPMGVPQPCMSQEFVDEYGRYEPVPTHARVGDTVNVEGDVHAPVKFGGVGIARIDAARPLTVTYLNSTSVYATPSPYVLYFPAGFQTPKPVRVNGDHFAVEVPLSDRGRAGRYEVSLWGRFPGDAALVMTSLRVIDVD